jgi:hypothetical protein
MLKFHLGILGGSAWLDLSEVPGEFSLSWFNPREGGSLDNHSVIGGGQEVILPAPSEKEDWLAVVKRRKSY